ncbi:hypothetical protein ADUPG1_014092, partial [Aduncisulcus paluster]
LSSLSLSSLSLSSLSLSSPTRIHYSCEFLLQ